MKSDFLAGFLTLVFFLIIEKFFPFKKFKSKPFYHRFNNLALAALNGILAFSFSFLILGVILWSGRKGYGINNWLGIEGAGAILVSFIAYDVKMYWWHRLSHEIPFLWNLHKVHHTDRYMDATTSLRFHPFEILLSNFIDIFIFFLIGMSLNQIVFYKSFLFLVIIFHHSNVDFNLKMDSRLKKLIVTPVMHRIHHSEIKKEHDSNYSSVFSFWDRAFRSFNRKKDVRLINFGINGLSLEAGDKFTKMLKAPFDKRY